MRAPEAALLAAVPQEEDAALGTNALGRALRVSVRHAQQSGRAGAIVIGAVVHVVAIGKRRAQADVVEVRAHHHELVFQYRVAAFQNSDHVFGVAWLAVDRQVDGELLDGIELEGIQPGVGLGGAERLRAGHLLALEERVGELQPAESRWAPRGTWGSRGICTGVYGGPFRLRRRVHRRRRAAVRPAFG